MKFFLIVWQVPSCSELPQRMKLIFLKFFLHSTVPSRPLYSRKIKIKKTLILVFEANIVASLNCTFFRILAHDAYIYYIIIVNSHAYTCRTFPLFEKKYFKSIWKKSRRKQAMDSIQNSSRKPNHWAKGNHKSEQSCRG